MLEVGQIMDDFFPSVSYELALCVANIARVEAERTRHSFQECVRYIVKAMQAGSTDTAINNSAYILDLSRTYGELGNVGLAIEYARLRYSIREYRNGIEW